MKTLEKIRDVFGSNDPGPSGLIGVYRRHAARAISEERWAAAGIFLERILEVDPRNLEAWLMKGHLHRFCHGDEETALECYRRVVVLGGYDTSNRHVLRAQQAQEQLLRRLA